MSCFGYVNQPYVQELPYCSSLPYCFRPLYVSVPRKGYKHIAMEMLSPMGATADATELYTRFVRDKEYEQLKSRGWFVIHGEVGDILLDRGVEYDDTIELGLRSFFGAKDITCKGIYAFRL